MKKNCILIILSFYAIALFAQNGVTIKGKLNTDDIPLLTLKSAKDSTVVSNTFPDSTNAFTFGVLLKGSYYIEGSQNGELIQVLKTNIIVDEESKDPIDVGTLNYKPNVHQLSTVVVTARKPIYQNKLGKYTFNVENSTFAQGHNTLEMLRQTPMMMVDYNNNITVAGKGPTIYINGRKSELQGDQLILYLKSIPADQIAKIEVMPVAPAKYDAAGTGGIVDIILKRNAKLGVNGSVSVTYQPYKHAGFYPNISINLNTKKFRFFVNGSYGVNDDGNTVDSKTVYFGSPENTVWEAHTAYQHNKSWNYYFNGGAEYFINDKNDLFFETSVQRSKRPWGTTDNTSIYGETSQKIDSLISSTSTGVAKNKVFSMDLNHTLTLKNIDGKLESAVGYFTNSGDNRTDYNSSVTTPTNYPLSQIDYSLNTPPSAWGVNAKTDLSGTFKNKVQYGTGLKYAYTNSGFEQQMDVANGTNSYDNYNYKENIAAAYMDLQYALNKKWSFKAGLRGEYTKWQGRNNVLNETNNKSYFDLFPTLFVQYKASDNHQFGLSYARRINRPYFSYLNPAKRFNNPYSYVVGNPNLNPEIDNEFDFTYTFKSKYSFFLAYSNSSNEIDNIHVMNNTTSTSYLMPVNIGSKHGVYANISAPITVIKDWWNANLSFSGQMSRSSDPANGYNDKSWQPTTAINVGNSFQLTSKNKTRAELNFFYVSTHLYGIQKVGPLEDLSVAITQKALKDQGMFKLEVSNITNWGVGHSQWMQSTSNTGSYYQMWKGYDYGMKLTFTYKFSSGLKHNTSNKSSINDEQKNRTKY